MLNHLASELRVSPDRGWGNIPGFTPKARSSRATGRSGDARRLRRAMVAFCLSVVPTYTFALDVAQRSAEACLNTDPASPNVAQQLLSIGWVQVPNDELANQDLLAISARMLGNRLGFGEAPKARWLAEWKLIQKGAEGTRRLRSVAGTPTQRSFFRHADAAGLVEVTLQSFPKLASVECQITVSSPLADKSLGVVATQQLTVSNPPIVFARNQELGIDPTPKSIGATYYNPKRIPDLIDTSFPFVGTIWVRNSLKR
ncbi:hypothetical protein [uncultured Tateyamaria sp.]|uniref:hypothetical protein n=1 Tax=uncultured Tateyamaria sp. TaxID=455651 RepID=UPI002631FFB7|nr:hypothetical protein [uncultured Tateyamaria sp.]